MVRRNVSQLKFGDRLQEDVHTPLGGVLLKKERPLYARDLEILRAFKVDTVNIFADEASEESEQQNDEEGSSLESVDAGFDKLYEDMVKLLKQMFAAVNGGASPPMMDLRQHLEMLIKHIDQYHILAFSPKQAFTHEYLYHNSIKVALTAYKLAGWYGLEQRDLIQVALAGLFHDIGNLKVDQAILLKPGKLTRAELEEVKQHTILGYNMIKHIAGINEGVKLCVLQHHEKEDGSGYPLGIMGDKIHIYAKIIAVADIYHAMTSKRQYKDANSPYLVLEQLYNESFGKLDPKVVQVFIHKVTQFHNGTYVRLNDGSIGEIVFSDREHPTRPWVNVEGKIINLTLERNLFIEAVIPR